MKSIVIAQRMVRPALLVLTTTAALVAAVPAAAGYQVQTSANTGRGYLRGCAAQYNIGGVGASFINNAGGGSPCVPADFLSYQNATVTATGTTDTTGTLTAAHDESSVVGGSDAAFSTAAADLATAQIHLNVSAVNFSSADATARLIDTLHFTVAGASASTVTLIPVSFAFNGSLTPSTDLAHASAELNYGFYFGNASAYEFGDYGAGYYDLNNPTFAYAGPAIVGGWASSGFASYDPLDTRFTGLYAITGATADIPIDFALVLRVTRSGLDYSQGGSVNIGQVAGVSFTSDSGVFASRAAGAVPEPASWAMLVLGFGVVGLAGRRRQAAVAA